MRYDLRGWTRRGQKIIIDHNACPKEKEEKGGGAREERRDKGQREGGEMR